MTRFTVIATPRATADVVRALLPSSPLRTRSADRDYFLYAVHGATQDHVFDDIDGELLVEMHSFDTLQQADAWVRADARLRHLIAGGLN